MSAFAALARNIALAFAGLGGLSGPAPAQELRQFLDHVALPRGFRIELYADVPGARSLAVAKELGAVFVGTLAQDIYVIRDANLDGGAGRAIKVKGGLIEPNGVAWRDGYLYVAARDRIVRFPGATMEHLVAAAPELLLYGLPDNRYQRARYAAIGPDGNIYVGIGAACNVCKVSGHEGTIIRLPTGGGEAQIFARGVRNSEGMDFQPATGVLFFTDNGADGMGDDTPPDELNRAPRAGMHFGFPWYGGGDVRTPPFANQVVPGRMTLPDGDFPAHVSPGGLHFYKGSQFPAEYRGDAFVALHGSGSRSVPDGFRVLRVRFDADGTATGYETFAEGWLRPDGSFWGRPTDIKELADGSLLISDDAADAVFRVTYAD